MNATRPNFVQPLPPHAMPTSPPASTSAASEMLIEKLGRALHRYGSPAHRLEEAMDVVARRLGLDGQFFSTPTAIFASFKPLADPLQPSRTVLLRVEPGEVNLEKLSLLDALLGKVVRGEVTPEGATQQVDEIVDASPRFGSWLTVLAFAMASGSASRFFGGGPAEDALAGVIGLMIGALAVVMGRFPNAGRLFEAIAAFLVASCGTLASVWFGQIAGQPVSFYIVSAAALIVLVPGLTLTVAMTELATRNLVSGGARMAGALLMFMTIGVGFAFGAQLSERLVGAPSAIVPPAQPLWSEMVALAVSAAALLVLFRAAPKDIGWFLVAAAGALLGSRAGSALFGPQLGALLGAVLIGIGGNLFARLRNRPAAIVHMPGLMLLVPGSLGFRSVLSLMDQETLSGVQTAFSVGTVAIALATGLLLAHVLLPPKRAL